MDKNLNDKKMKRDININKNSISSEEILGKKNFEELYANFAAGIPGAEFVPKKPFYKSGWFSGGLATILLATVATVFIVNNKEENFSKTDQNESDKSLILFDLNKNEKPFISPPVDGIDVVKSNYIINANEGGKITHHTGSVINFPANVFTDIQGNLINGDVEIEYREFHDHADIFFSGIPMNYDSAGLSRIFESAGMVEIHAFQNGKKLLVAPEKEIEICLSSRNPDPKFNLYYLNEEKQKWDYMGKDKIITESDSEGDHPIYYSEGNNTNESNTIISDLDNDCQEKKKSVIKQEDVVKVIRDEIKKIEKEAPTKPKKANKDNYSFDINVDPKEFPELATYKGMIFEALDQKNFDPQVYNIQWENIELKKESKKNISVCLSKGEAKKNILVFPVFEGKNYTQAMATFNEKFDDYSQKLSERKNEEEKAEKELKEKKKAYEEALAERERRQKEYLASLSDDQRKIAKANLLASKLNRKINRIFSVNRFGTWNCDSPVSRPSGVKIWASFKDKSNDDDLDCITMSLIQKKMNAVFPLHSNSFQFNPKRINFLWGVTKDKKLVIAKQDEFINAKKKKKDGKYTFEMEVIDVKDKSLDEIKDIIKA